MAMFVTTGRLWGLRIPLVLLLKNFTSLAEKSVWFAMVGSNFLICIAGLILFLIGRWKVPVVDEKKITWATWKWHNKIPRARDLFYLLSISAPCPGRGQFELLSMMA